jgi:CHAT domain-containing protein
MISGREATEEAFRKNAPKHRFLHLATHGYFAPPSLRSALATANADSGRLQLDRKSSMNVIGMHPGLLSGLALAGANRKPEPDAHDGILSAEEVATMNLSKVDLVVLSACETGLGKVAGGEGLLGLQRAFQVAGAKSVVASLWQVDDNATRVLMAEFYRNLWEKKLSKLESLRQAQITMLRSYDPKAGKLRGVGGVGPKRPSPFYWAPFVLSGDWR